LTRVLKGGVYFKLLKSLFQRICCSRNDFDFHYTQGGNHGRIPTAGYSYSPMALSMRLELM